MNQSRNKKNRRRTKKKRSVLKKIFSFLMFVIALVVVGGGLTVGYFAITAPELTAADLEGSVETKIYDINEELIAEIGGENREIVAASEVPEQMKNAIISIEDQRFYKHFGIDPIRIVGAAVSNIKNKSLSQGGSTITQQLIKLSKFSTANSDRTFKRKIQEAILALKVEHEYSKEQILTLYLNKIYLANNVFGVRTAAKYYFDKPLNELTLAQTALLAGMPQAPSNYDPYRHPEEATRRRNLVLQQMHSMKFISDEDYNEAINEPLEQNLITEHTENELDLVNDSFIQVIVDEVKRETDLDVYKDGLTIYTTLDTDAQNKLYDLVNNSDVIPYRDQDMQSAVTVLDSKTGGIKAIIGGRHQEVLLGYNRATQLKRSIGSTIKPLTDYGPAIEYSHMSTGETIVDEPYKYSNGDPINNWDRDYMGTMTARTALAYSRNIPALKIFQKNSRDNIDAFLKKLDIRLNNHGSNGLVEANSITGEVSPLKLAGAYRAFANEGMFQKPHGVTRIIKRDGEEIELNQSQDQVLKPETAYMVTDMLKDVFSYGTASNINSGLPEAGKTGTSNYTDDQLKQLGLVGSEGVPDSWFVGYTQDNVISVWTGYDDPFKTEHALNYQDQEISKLIYRQMMNYFNAQAAPSDWKQPNNVVRKAIVLGSQPLALAGQYTPANMIRNELFIKGHLPANTLYFEKPKPELEAPTNVNATYNAAAHSVTFTWIGPDIDDLEYEVSVNGQTTKLKENSLTVTNVDPGDSISISITAFSKGKKSDSVSNTFTVPDSSSSNKTDTESSDDTTPSPNSPPTNPESVTGSDTN
ncbi:penicillin-binding protein 1A [Atopobacter phocae]|uniref:penicillin-binding protein 1A n=1 Tax=Atopobacter phocae TaxID=136492 RepID=UPI000471942C|nr:penicillin-binding protein 1A [Atopobacter phocae]